MSLRFSSALIAGAMLVASTFAHTSTLAKTGPQNPRAANLPATASSLARTPKQAHTTYIRGKGPVGVSDDAGISGTALAVDQGIIAYCEKIDPQSAGLYAQKLTSILLGTTGQNFASLQGTAAYSSELAWLNSSLASVPRATGLSACKGFLALK